jgi:hypothetical protein
MKNNYYIFLGLFFLSGCISEHQKTELTYQNITILSDMSSRLINKPNKDSEEINIILDYFVKECVKPGEKINDKSSIFFSSFSNKMIASIDIGIIKDLGEKQKFINSTGEYKSKGLYFKVNEFKEKVGNAYAKIRNPGIDLISVLSDKIENDGIVKENTFLTDGIDTTFVNYDNHLYIFTDGYLEYVNKKENSQFYFGVNEIKQIRDYCKSKKVTVNKALEQNSTFSIPPVREEKNKLIKLHVFETHERDKNEKLQTYQFPKGVRDNEILEAVWRKWAKESGFISFEWKKY